MGQLRKFGVGSRSANTGQPRFRTAFSMADVQFRRDRCTVEMRAHGAITNNREVSKQAVAKANEGVWRRADLHQPAGAWLATKTAN
jgi:hypothetical protein